MNADYSQLREHFNTQAVGRLQEREAVEKHIRELSLQLRAAAADIHRRFDTFAEHTDHVRRIIALTQRMKKDFKNGRLDVFENDKKDIRAAIETLRKNILNLYNNISIEKSDTSIIIRIENQISADVQHIRSLTLDDYRILKDDYSEFLDVAKAKASASLVEDKKSIGEAAQTMAVINKLISLTANLAEFTDRLASMVKKEEEILAKLNIEPGKSIDPAQYLLIERELSATLREIFLLLREEKQNVHDPFLKLIRKEQSGLEAAQELMQRTRLPWWKKIFGKGTSKITQKDIRRTINRFTEETEYNTFATSLKNHPELLDTDALELVASLFTQSLVELKKKKVFSDKDELTKLYNKRYFKSYMTTIVERGREFSLFVIDIDHFKQFNDTYGHLVGDTVLREVAGVISASTRVTDVAVRWGGEELAVLFPSTSLNDAFKVAERIRVRIEQRPVVDLEGKPIRQVTVSGGLIHVSKEWLEQNPRGRKAERVLEDIFEHADKKLYEAKNAGRNRIMKEDLVVSEHKLLKTGS